MTQIAQPVARPPGRPSRTSREEIISAALMMLQADGIDGFAMGKLARSVKVTVMTLYNYFPSRDALLDAVAETIFATFQPPMAGADWETKLKSWLDALLALFERHPIGIELIKWDEHVAPAWMRIWLSMVRVLFDEGLKGEQLVIASGFVGQAALGLIMAQPQIQRIRPVLEPTRGFKVDPPDRLLLGELIGHTSAATTRQTYEFGTRSILAAIAGILGDRKAAPDPRG